MPEPIHAVFFDLDGTLVRTHIDFPAMREAVWSHFGTMYPTRMDAAMTPETDTLALIPHLLRFVPDGEREPTRRKLLDVVVAHEQVGCAKPEPIPGATELLLSMKERGIKVGIVTRNARAIAEPLCDQMRLTHDVLVAREDTMAFKPDPEPVHFACTCLGVSAQNAIMIGDLWADVAAGIAAGCASTIGIQWNHDPPNRFAKCPPSHEVSTLSNAGEVLLEMLLQKSR